MPERIPPVVPERISPAVAVSVNICFDPLPENVDADFGVVAELVTGQLVQLDEERVHRHQPTAAGGHRQ